MTPLRRVPAAFCIVLLAACTSSPKSSAASSAPPVPTSTDTATTVPGTGLSLPTDFASGLPTTLPTLNGKGCEALTPEKISAAAGFEVKAPQASDLGPMVVCIYGGPTGNAVLIRVEKGIGAVGWEAGKAALNSANQKTTPLPGVGDEAYSAGVPGTYTVGIRKGGGDIVATIAGSLASVDKTIAVAKVALDNSAL